MLHSTLTIFSTLFIISLELVNGLPVGTSLEPSESFPYNATIDADGKYTLFWKFNATDITFEVHVQTFGYVGFGLSSNGKMFPSDVVVGWVKSGVAHFKVMFENVD